MTSRNLFFKLMRENIKRRLWTVALTFLAFFFLFPVYTALLSSELEPGRAALMNGEKAVNLAVLRAEFLESYLRWISLSNPFIVMLLILAAVICGVSGFSYLHSRQKTDFYHALPVKREVLFVTVYAEGFLYTAIPFLLNLLAASLLVQIKAASAFPWGTVLAGFAMHMAFYLLLYSTVILAVVLTGNLIVSLLGVGVFFFWGPCALGLKTEYFNHYFRTFYAGLPETWMDKSSPFAWYLFAASSDTGLAGKALWALAAAVLVSSLALVLYKKRPSEAAGHAMAFRKSRFPIKLLLVVPLALLGSLLFAELMQSDGWSIFGLLCGLLISYAVIEIIYHFDFRKLFAHRGELAVCAVVSAACLVFFRFDLLGYDSYLPPEAEIESSGIYCYLLDDDALSYQEKPVLKTRGRDQRPYIVWEGGSELDLLDTMKLGKQKNVLSIAAQGIEDAKRMKREQGHWYRGRLYGVEEDETGEEAVYSSVSVQYCLKNGKRVFRSYYLNLSAVRDALDSLYEQPEYKSAVYPVLALDAENVAGVNYQEYSDFSHVSFADKAMKARLLETYQGELAALTADTRRQENPVAALQFKTNEVQGIIDALRAAREDISSFNRENYYPVYPSFHETIRLLGVCGIEVGEGLTAKEVEEIVLTDHYDNDGKMEKFAGADEIAQIDARPRTLTVTDKAQIEALLRCTSSEELNCDNLLNGKVPDISVTARVPRKEEDGKDEFTDIERTYSEGQDPKYETYRLSLDADRIPEFVREAFQFDEKREKTLRHYGY